MTEIKISYVGAEYFIVLMRMRINELTRKIEDGEYKIDDVRKFLAEIDKAKAITSDLERVLK